MDRGRTVRGLALLGLALSLSACTGGARRGGEQDSAGGAAPAPAFSVEVVPAAILSFPGANRPGPGEPGDCDCNSPAHWDGGTFYVFNSSGHPWRSSGADLFHLTASYDRVEFDNEVNGGRWFECTWKDEAGGTLYGWYHFEPGGLCEDPERGRHLTAPRIGAARSRDDGATWEDLGVILTQAGELRCDTANFYFAGGNGDFSAMLDADEEYMYFFISTYGDLAEQGVSVARMPWRCRDAPVGAVRKWHAGAWNEPGLGGRVTPIFPAAIDWHRPDADAFWGPSIHWNVHLGSYVILLNRAVDLNWKQEGVYVTFNADLGDPAGWSRPRKILDREEILPHVREKSCWYPQVIGLDAAKRETDKLAGRRARLFIRGDSSWEILFSAPAAAP